MDRFWAGEEKWLSRLTNALKDRRLDPTDIGHWGGFQESLNQIHADWEVWLSSHLGHRLSGFTGLQESVSSAVAPEYGLGSDAASVVKKRRLSPSAPFLAQTSLVQAESELDVENKPRVKFFKECVQYGEDRENEIRKMLDTPYFPFSLSRASRDLAVRATTLRTEGSLNEVSAIQGASVQFAFYFC